MASTKPTYEELEYNLALTYASLKESHKEIKSLEEQVMLYQDKISKAIEVLSNGNEVIIE